MNRKFSFFVGIAAICALVGFTVLQAASSEKGGLVSPSTTNRNVLPSNPAKPTPEQEQVARDRALKQSMEQARITEESATEAENVSADELMDQQKQTRADQVAELMARVQRGETLSAFEKSFVDEFVQQTGMEWPTPARNENPLDNTGGGDASSYYFVDNATGDSASFSWIELCDSTGTTDGPIGDDAASGAISLGFTFPFYGANYTTCYVSTNGQIGFVAAASGYQASDPAATAPTNPYIAPLWGDQYAALSGGCANTGVAPWIRYKTIGTGQDQYFVVEWRRNGEYNSGSAPTHFFSYEALIFPNGNVKVQFSSDPFTVPTLASRTWAVGIDAPGATNGVRYWYYNTTGPVSLGITPDAGRAIWFYQYHFPNDFATSSILSPGAGGYAPNASVSVTAHVLNNGTTSQLSPVSYIFNGGATVTENTGVLAAGQTEDHTFGTQITLPAGVGSYPLTVWTDLATDQVHSNDTLRMNVVVFTGDDCPAAIVITPVPGVPDSATWNNTGATNNTPGQYCGASGGDMVWTVSVPNGHQLDMWETIGNGSLDSRHTMKWGGCPTGSGNLLDCTDDPDNQRFRYVNHTGSSQDAYLVAGYFSTGSFGNLVIAWSDSVPPAAPVPTSGSPFVETFDLHVPDALRYPAGWSIENTDQLNVPWRTYASNPRSTPRCASIPGAATVNNDWLFSNGINMTGGVGYVLEFWWRGNSTTVPESLEVKAGNSNTSAAMTLNVMAMDSIKRTVYVQRVSNFTPASTGVYYFGWHSVTRQSSGRSYIDDIQVYPSGSCSAPSVTVNSPTAQDSVAMFANAVGGSGGPTEYQWFTGTTCDMANVIVGARSATYYAHASGPYACRAWIIDSVGCAACGTGTATVIDCSVGASIPYTQNFDAVTIPALPVCWSMQDADNTSPVWVTSTGGPNSPPNSAFISWRSPSIDDWLFTSRLQLTGGTTYLLDYWYRAASTSYYEDLTVFFGTANNAGGMTTQVGSPLHFNTITYTEQFETFTPPTTGVYYIGWHGTSLNALGMYVDDIVVSIAGACSAPTVNVADSSRVGTVHMFCNATGGSGGSLVYQWYTGQTCSQANAIPGATSSTYTTFVDGDFACRAYRADSVNCAACDWGHATVLPPPPGETCNNPIIVTPPNPNDSSLVSGTTVGFIADNTDTCEFSETSYGPDVYYSLTLTTCRRVAFKLESSAGGSGDMHISVYESGHCGTQAILCDDDKANFATIPWENPAQRPTQSLSSFAGGELSAGTYLIRVGYYSTSSGTFLLTAYDNGPCGCVISCQGGDQIEATENRYDQAYFTTDPDGGCNNTVPTYGTIAPGQTVCGVGFEYFHTGTRYRDTDWYTFTLASDATMNFTVTPEFPALIGFIASTSPCPTPPFVISLNAPECVPTVVTSALAAGSYSAFVSPQNFVGNPLPSPYRATLAFACTPDTVTNLTAYIANVDADPTANDIRLKWTARSGFTGTYSVYYNTIPDVFPGTWQLLQSNMTPVFGPNAMTYVHDDGATTGAKHFYLVVSECGGVVAASVPVTKSPPELAR